MAESLSVQLAVKRAEATARHISNHSVISGGSFEPSMAKMVWLALSHQASPLRRVESTTTASGVGSGISGQNRQAGKSEVDPNPSRKAVQSTFPPSAASRHVAM